VEEDLGSHAWSIINYVHSQIKKQEDDEPRLLTEVSRLVSLNLILNSRFTPGFLGLKGAEFLLDTLSFEGTQHDVSKKRVRTLVNSSSNIELPIESEILQKMDLNDFVNLLGWIHSLGSYRLPVSLNHGTSQRSLGAYYTPPEVADYIVSLTMKDELDRGIQSISKNGISAFHDFITLRILDPACGAGVFLISALTLLQSFVQIATNVARKAGISQSEIDQELSDVDSNLYGVDLDSGALETADISLRILNSKYSSKIGYNLKRGNSLVSMNGFNGRSNHREFFENPSDIPAFEWKQEFSEVFQDSDDGFDFIVMNPPYERLKPNFAEFLRERLASGNRRIHTDAYESRKKSISEFSNYFRESKEYHYTTSYSLNTYQLFIERSLQLARKDGIIGCIVPSNLLGDVSAQRLRDNLIQRNNVRTIDDFPETSRIFPGVTQSVSIISIQKGGQTQSILAGFNRQSIDEATRRKRLKFGKEQIIKTMGSTLAIPRISSSGFKLLDFLHENPLLGSLEDIVIRRGELDLTNNRNAITQTDTSTPLIRGSHISRFSLNKNSHKSEFVEMDVFAKTLKASSRADHFKIERIACQQVSNMGQRWRLKFAKIPPGTILANSCNYLVVDENNSVILDYYLGILNSELMNWRFQIGNFNNHVSIRELQNLPIVRYNRRNKIASNLIASVKSQDLASIEANVFQIYGFNIDQVRSVLDFRKTPQDERQSILKSYSQMIY